jgi:hypothetical protein
VVTVAAFADARGCRVGIVLVAAVMWTPPALSQVVSWVPACSFFGVGGPQGRRRERSGKAPALRVRPLAAALTLV